MSIIIIILLSIAFIILAFFFFWKVVFLRDPERTIPSGNNIVSPADGKVVHIQKIHKKKDLTIKKGKVGKIHTLLTDLPDECYVISIFMSPLDVHINRSPMKGEVISVKKTKGKFLPVMTFEAGLQNEKSEILIKTKIGNIKVIQIAGFLARRIVTTVKPKQNIDKGQRIGLINLGSQATIIIPTSTKLKVKLGDYCYAGTSILATYKK